MEMDSIRISEMGMMEQMKFMFKIRLYTRYIYIYIYKIYVRLYL